MSDTDSDIEFLEFNPPSAPFYIRRTEVYDRRTYPQNLLPPELRLSSASRPVPTLTSRPPRARQNRTQISSEEIIDLTIVSIYQIRGADV